MTNQARSMSAVFILGLWASVAATGCGETTNVNITQPAPGAPGQVPPPPTNVTVRITEVFNPTPIIVKQHITNKVATVIIVNNENDHHSIVADNGRFNSGVIGPGEEKTFTVDEPGDFPFHCGVHPDDANERGVLRVEPSDQPGASPSPSPTASPSITPTFSPTASPSPSPSVEPAEQTITIAAGASTRTTDAFGTEPLSVRQNSVVTVINNDTDDHTATSDDGTTFDTGIIPPGERAMFIVNQAGEFPFHCTVHPNMRGTLRVMLNGQPSPGTSPSPSPSPTEPLNQ